MIDPLLDIETFVGDQPDPDIDAAQKLADTAEEDQDEDPETTPEEAARIWKIFGSKPGGAAQ